MVKTTDIEELATKKIKARYAIAYKFSVGNRFGKPKETTICEGVTRASMLKKAIESKKRCSFKNAVDNAKNGDIFGLVYRMKDDAKNNRDLYYDKNGVRTVIGEFKYVV